LVDCLTCVKARHRLWGTGFTLVELLVTISVIAILASLLFPVISRAKAQARSATCKNRLHQVGLALQMYVNDNGGKYPYAFCLANANHDNVADANWFNRLEPYYPIKWTDRSYHCPGYGGAIDVGAIGPASHDPYGSYAYNWRGVRGFLRQTGPERELGLGTAHSLRRQQPEVPEPQVKVPSEMFAIGESRFWQQNRLTKNADCVAVMFCGFLSDSPGRPITFPTRHGKNYNQLFCDGHITAMDPWILFNPTNTAAMWNNDHQPHPELWPTY
jgi:prepilin-type N-terminal cleavage/methylation domain-containing protein/prepilin-type processing-associated H-X9-DG protein